MNTLTLQFSDQVDVAQLLGDGDKVVVSDGFARLILAQLREAVTLPDDVNVYISEHADEPFLASLADAA